MRETSIYEMNVPDNADLEYPEWYTDSLKRNKGKCIYCGGGLPKRKRRYCSDNCRFYSQCAAHDLCVNSMRRYVHQFYKYECQECGKHFSSITPAGTELPEHWGIVHHQKPLHKGGIDDFYNLILLCDECHKKKHKKEG